MKRSSYSSTVLLLLVAATMATSAESRRSFGGGVGVPAFFRQSTSQQANRNNNLDHDDEDDYLARTDNALCQASSKNDQPPSQRHTTAQHCTHTPPDEPNDREVRHAMQRGDEIRASRAVEYAYLQLHDDDEEFAGVIPAAAFSTSNRKVVPSHGSRRPLLDDSDLYHV